MNLGNGLVYIKKISDKEKIFNFGNLSLKVKDYICPVVINNKILEKRIFEIGKKNKVIFSFKRKEILVKSISIKGFIKIFDIYKRISFDEKKVIYTLPNYSVKNIKELNYIFNDFKIDFVKFYDYMNKDLIVEFDKNILNEGQNNFDISFYISFLLAGFLFYGDFVIKEDKFISFKVFWPIVNLEVKKFLDEILNVLAKNNIFVYPYLISNQKVYQWNIEDWELIDNILNLLKLDYINYQKSYTYNIITELKEKFKLDDKKYLIKVVEYK